MFQIIKLILTLDKAKPSKYKMQFLNDGFIDKGEKQHIMQWSKEAPEKQGHWHLSVWKGLQTHI